MPIASAFTALSATPSVPAAGVQGATPPKPLAVRLELVPKLTVEGVPGSTSVVERAERLAGPWTAWTNVVINAEGSVLVDLSPGASTRFYRAVVDVKPNAPEGFVWIPAGNFTMGSPAGESGRRPEEVQRPVTISRGFWISDHEVTQAEYQAVMGTNPSMFRGDENLPVEMVQWTDAAEYCRKRTELERAAGKIGQQQAYRLPTEAEWEYAARAGTTGIRHGDLNDIAWWLANTSGNGTRPVRRKTPNAWGLHDMIGNVGEWCADWYGPYPSGASTDPSGPPAGTEKVVRGGGWHFDDWLNRSAVRRGFLVDSRFFSVGFRPVLTP